MRNKFLFFCFTYIVVFVISSFTTVTAQNTKFAVNTSGAIKDIVKSLEGPGVTITDVDFSGELSNNPVGSFDDALGVIDVKKGLIMTSGSAKLAIGPNNNARAGAGQKTMIQGNDTDLELLIPGENLFDVFTIEFDIHVTNSILSFNYIFGSEEYPEFEREYNDVFGFFISGPGITGEKNLAVLPDGTPISVKSINSKKNTDYFVSNGGGDNPAHDFYLQYDGFTKKLIAKIDVIPCGDYHIKFAIADAKDDILDSGVLIEAGSFTSTSMLDIDLAFEHEGFGYAVEGCNKGYFIINKNLEWIAESDSVTYEFKLSENSAIRGQDYLASIKDTPNRPLEGNTITIDAGEKSTTIEIDALVDIDIVANETVQLDILLRCGVDIIATASSVMIIKDSIDYPINSFVCKDVLMPINTDAADRWEFRWNANDSLVFSEECLPDSICRSPSVQLSFASQFAVHVRDTQSGCETTTQAFVTIKELVADFNYYKDVNYTTADAFFKNLSVGAETYEWNFGDGETARVFEPHHYYETTGETLDPVTYKINLKVTALQGACVEEHDTTIVVIPFYLQNVFTPNNDLWNQQFAVNGIEPGVWKMEIYNRWGEEVFTSNAYMNNWEGDNVNTGVYYFKLKNPPGDREFKGWIHVLK